MLYRVKNVIWHLYVFFVGFARKNIFLYWYKERENFGDAVNYFLVKKISKKKPLWVNPKYWPFEHFLAIGSVLELLNTKSVVWGSGFISEIGIVSNKPKKICAVRGPRTRKKFIDNGIECPEIYGDPALLLPLFYSPTIRKRYKIGIVPHYADKNNQFIDSLRLENDVNIIDIEHSDPEVFIDQILECEYIFSSSLHGIIVSDAYAIPSIWVKFSGNVKGDGFKFFDYFESVGRFEEKQLQVNEEFSPHEEILKHKPYKITFDADKLLNVNPFEL